MKLTISALISLVIGWRSFQGNSHPPLRRTCSILSRATDGLKILCLDPNVVYHDAVHPFPFWNFIHACNTDFDGIMASNEVGASGWLNQNSWQLNLRNLRPLTSLHCPPPNCSRWIRKLWLNFIGIFGFLVPSSESRTCLALPGTRTSEPKHFIGNILPHLAQRDNRPTRFPRGEPHFPSALISLSRQQ